MHSDNCKYLTSNLRDLIIVIYFIVNTITHYISHCVTTTYTNKDWKLSFAWRTKTSVYFCCSSDAQDIILKCLNRSVSFCMQHLSHTKISGDWCQLGYSTNKKKKLSEWRQATGYGTTSSFFKWKACHGLHIHHWWPFSVTHYQGRTECTNKSTTTKKGMQLWSNEEQND